MAFDLAYPLQVKLTPRGMKIRQDSRLTVFHRWRVVRWVRQFGVPDSLAAQLASVPIICVAVDRSPEGERLAEAHCSVTVIRVSEPRLERAQR